MDYIASMGVLVPVVAWGFYVCLAAANLGPAGAWGSPLAPAALTALGLGLAAWRVRLIRRVLAGGVEVPATVVQVAHTRGQRVRVRYQYEHAGQTYSGGNTLSEGRVPVRLKAGEAVTVVVDPARPRVAFLREAFG